MKFKLVESIDDRLVEDRLVENTYGMTQKQQKHSLEQTLFSTRMLDIIINNKPMNPGFTLHSNESGNIVNSDNPNDIFHHMGLFRGDGTPLAKLKNLKDHNNIHNDLMQLIKCLFKEYSNILQQAYNQYEKDYSDAHRNLKKTSLNEYYTVIGKKLKAYEDYFRNVRNSLYKVTDPSFIGDKLDNLISKYNLFSDIHKDAEEIEKVNPFVSKDEA